MWAFQPVRGIRGMGIQAGILEIGIYKGLNMVAEPKKLRRDYRVKGMRINRLRGEWGRWECSPWTGEGLERAFYLITRDVLRNLPPQEQGEDPGSGPVTSRRGESGLRRLFCCG